MLGFQYTQAWGGPSKVLLYMGDGLGAFDGGSVIEIFKPISETTSPSHNPSAHGFHFNHDFIPGDNPGLGRLSC